MQTIDPEVVREVMRSAFGDVRYKNFVAELNGRCQSKNRLFYWQETMWNQVQTTLGIHVTEFETISSLFRHCHVHGPELEKELVPVLYGTRQFTGSYIEALEAFFPYANNVALGPCWHEPPTEREVFFCERCREEKAKWEAKNDA
jgi:hypothetical protein